MPFVNIRLVGGRSQEQKDEISKRVVDGISDVLQLPRDDIWVDLKMSPPRIGMLAVRRSPRFARRRRNEFG